jgi:hypothetical protein
MKRTSTVRNFLSINIRYSLSLGQTVNWVARQFWIPSVLLFASNYMMEEDAVVSPLHNVLQK